jgi:quercetin dioxygenase-like cupin family protein
MNTITETHIEDSSLEWEVVNELVRRKIMAYDESLMLVKADFQKGGIGPIHHHYHSQITHIESGVFDVTIGEETKTLKAGDSFYIPPNVPHGATAIEAGLLIDVFSPMREDFVQL